VDKLKKFWNKFKTLSRGLKITMIVGVLVLASIICVQCSPATEPKVIPDGKGDVYGDTSLVDQVEVGTPVHLEGASVEPTVEPTEVPTIAPTIEKIVVQTYVVARVVDGDTVELSNGSFVRLLGIDTPERGECGYQEATDYLISLVEGKEVYLIEDSLADDVDRYGRLLRYIEIEDSLGGINDINWMLVWVGYADSFKYDSSTGYPYEREEFYHKSQGVLFVCPLPTATIVPTKAPVYIPVPTTAPVDKCSGQYFQNCTAMRDAGCAPAIQGRDNWYRTAHDRDGDGVGCE